MKRWMIAVVAGLCGCAGVAGSWSVAHATPVAYWRMEVDNDPTAGGLSVPNELAGSPLTSSEAELDGSNLPVGIVPLTFATNFFSVAATNQGGSAGINATAAWYPQLDVTSVTIEFWARTQESQAEIFRWGDGTSEGILIDDPNGLDVSFVVDDAGTPTVLSMSNLDNMGTLWSHYAFTYEETTGIGRFYVDGVEVASVDGPDGATFHLASDPDVEVGMRMDFIGAGQGTVDEVRIHDIAVAPGALLIPEPGPALLVAVVLASASLRRRRP